MKNSDLLVGSRKTEYMYVREGRTHERPRGGCNNVKVDDEMKQCLNKIVDENCLLTLSEINRELRRRLPAKPLVHDRTVGKTLDGMLIRIKLARPLPADRNRPDPIRRRVEYANWFMTNGFSIIVYLSTNAGTIYGPQEAMGELELVKGPIDKSSVSAEEM